MGRYMNRKAKITDDVAVMEVPQSTLIGVLTRAKTLALQRLHSSTSTAAADPSPDSDDSSCYLQLRSRRLEKPSLLKPQTPKSGNPRSGSRLRLNDYASSGSVKSGSIRRSKVDEDFFGNRVADDETEQGFDLAIEASFGENNLDFQAWDRSTRESTPCSFIREGAVSTPPGSSTRQRTLDATNRRSRNAVLRNIPTTHEMDEFFAPAEQQQQQQFIEKYNYDIVADMPLPGRYEWMSVNY